MAEVVGLVASIVQIAGAGAKLSSALYHFTTSAVRADQDISDIASDIELTSNALESIGKVFETENTECIISKKAILDANSIIKPCDAVFKDISELVEKRSTISKQGKKGLSLVRKLSWPMKEQRVELYRRRLESLKNSLTLLLHVLQLAQGQAQGQLEMDTIEREREKIRELHQRQQDSLKCLQALEAKLSKIALDDKEISGESKMPFQGPTPQELSVFSTQVPGIHPGADTFPNSIPSAANAAASDIDTSESDGNATDDEGDPLSLEELAKAEQHVRRLLKRITQIQQSTIAPKDGTVHSKKRINRIYQRVCCKWETSLMNGYVVPRWVASHHKASAPTELFGLTYSKISPSTARQTHSHGASFGAGHYSAPQDYSWQQRAYRPSSVPQSPAGTARPNGRKRARDDDSDGGSYEPKAMSVETQIPQSYSSYTPERGPAIPAVYMPHPNMHVISNGSVTNSHRVPQMPPQDQSTPLDLRIPPHPASSTVSYPQGAPVASRTWIPERAHDTVRPVDVRASNSNCAPIHSYNPPQAMYKTSYVQNPTELDSVGRMTQPYLTFLSPSTSNSTYAADVIVPPEAFDLDAVENDAATDEPNFGGKAARTFMTTPIPTITKEITGTEQVGRRWGPLRPDQRQQAFETRNINAPNMSMNYDMSDESEDKKIDELVLPTKPYPVVMPHNARSQISDFTVQMSSAKTPVQQSPIVKPGRRKATVSFGARTGKHDYPNESRAWDVAEMGFVRAQSNILNAENPHTVSNNGQNVEDSHLSLKRQRLESAYSLSVDEPVIKRMRLEPPFRPIQSVDKHGGKDIVDILLDEWTIQVV